MTRDLRSATFSTIAREHGINDNLLFISENILSGHVFIFRGRNGSQVKNSSGLPAMDCVC